MIIVMVMHGAPPNDFPRQELAEFFTLQGRLRRESGPDKKTLTERYEALSQKIKDWPRTAKNDPFYAGSQDLGERLSKISGHEVLVGYNDFCAPDVNEALEEAARKGTETIMVVTPMMTRGGEHAEKEIPALLQDFQKTHPKVKVIYAWPFDVDDVAGFLAKQVTKSARGG